MNTLKLVCLYGILCFVLTGMLSTSIFAQSPLQKVREKVEYDQILRNWKLNETKDFQNVKILRMEGENESDHRTNLLYLSSFCEPDSLYGKLVIFTDRNDEALADPSLLVVKIMDAKGEKVFLEYTPEGAPQYYKQDIWYNHIELVIPESVEKQFLVHITDNGLKKEFLFFVFGLPEFCYSND